MNIHVNPFFCSAAFACLIAIAVVQSATAAIGTWSCATDGTWNISEVSRAGSSGNPWSGGSELLFGGNGSSLSVFYFASAGAILGRRAVNGFSERRPSSCFASHETKVSYPGSGHAEAGSPQTRVLTDRDVVTDDLADHRRSGHDHLVEHLPPKGLNSFNCCP